MSQSVHPEYIIMTQKENIPEDFKTQYFYHMSLWRCSLKTNWEDHFTNCINA